MENLLKLSYWFDLRPTSLNQTAQIFFIASLALFLLIILLIFIAKKKMGIYRGFFRKISDFSVANLLIGSLLFFFDYETIPFFAARFWLFIWIIVMLVWLFFIFKNLKKIKATKHEKGQVDEFKKYLP